jgi:hypothetical protein
MSSFASRASSARSWMRAMFAIWSCASGWNSTF